jgi:hypothetical protein
MSVFEAVQDFHIVLPDGSERFVQRGEQFPGNHEIVKHDGDRGVLFRRLVQFDPYPEEKPPRKGAA